MEPAYRSSRREAIVAGVIFAVTCVWVIGVCSLLTYGKPIHSIGGIPNWAVWGIFLPWLGCLIANVWYSLIYMGDDDGPNEPPSGGDRE